MGKESSQSQENIKFMKYATNTQINASSSLNINLQADRSEYGNNFNTFIILNTSTVNIKIYLDDKEFSVVNGNNGSLSFDWQDGIIYNSIKLENLSGATNADASTLFITYGRTGLNGGN
jgi:hypothetical protein